MQSFRFLPPVVLEVYAPKKLAQHIYSKCNVISVCFFFVCVCVTGSASEVSPTFPFGSSGFTPRGKGRGCWRLLCVAYAIVVAACLLLLCSGDIETNPGPSECNYKTHCSALKLHFPLFIWVAILARHDFAKVCRLASDASDKWYELGLVLGVKDEILIRIQEKNSSNKAICFNAVLKVWWLNCRNVDDLTAALEQSHIGCQDIAKRVRAGFVTSNDPEAHHSTAVEDSGKYKMFCCYGH